MKASTIIVTVLGVGLAVGGVFFLTRKAAAADKATKAFIVGPDCSSFLVVDEELAKGSFVAAFIAVAPAPTMKAIDALKAILSYMFPECDWNDPPDEREFIRGNGQHLSWGSIKSAVGERTVAEVKSIADKFGGLQGAVAGKESPLPWPFQWGMGTGGTFGTGCMSCFDLAYKGYVTPAEAFGSGGDDEAPAVGAGTESTARDPVPEFSEPPIIRKRRRRR